jgi:hypothetical protein
LSVFVAGSSPQLDLTQPLSLSIKNFVIANWPTSGVLVLASRIKFGNKWFDDYGTFQIHFTDGALIHTPFTLGWQYEIVNAVVNAYIFVKKNTRLRPPELYDIRKSLTDIIQPNRLNPGNIAAAGSAVMRIIRTIDSPQQHPTDDLWQSLVQIGIRYYAVSTI